MAAQQGYGSGVVAAGVVSSASSGGSASAHSRIATGHGSNTILSTDGYPIRPRTSSIPVVRKHHRSERPHRLLIMGPQGSGKGTQSKRLADAFSIPNISTGEIFRANIKAGTELGRIAQKYTDQGELVPDEITDSMVKERLSAPDVVGGFILDGYPRTEAQVASLDRMLADLNWKLDGVVELTADREELLRRIAGRAGDEGRPDDTPAALTRRLDIYHARTAPLTDEYARRGLLARVNGIGDVDAVTARIIKDLDRIAAD
jgi:adenylate kinase